MLLTLLFGFLFSVILGYALFLMAFMNRIDAYVKEEKELCDKVCREFSVPFPPFELRTNESAFYSCRKVNKS